MTFDGLQSKVENIYLTPQLTLEDVGKEHFVFFPAIPMQLLGSTFLTILNSFAEQAKTDIVVKQIVADFVVATGVNPALQKLLLGVTVDIGPSLLNFLNTVAVADYKHNAFYKIQTQQIFIPASAAVGAPKLPIAALIAESTGGTHRYHTDNLGLVSSVFDTTPTSNLSAELFHAIKSGNVSPGDTYAGSK